jgi:starvation-inducible DNA-binding protein
MTDKKETIVKLKALLASTYTLYLKTHNYHWNVTGPMFSSLHILFETHYTELAMAVDEIAERIRALGAKAPGSYSEFEELSLIKESTGEPTATEMLKDLTSDQEIIAKLALEVVGAASAVGDEATAGIATDRQSIHEKNAWMLRSHLE